MQRFYDRMILFLGSVFLLFSQGIDTREAIITLLCAVILGCFGTVLGLTDYSSVKKQSSLQRYCIGFLGILWLVSSLIYCPLQSFVPLAIYELLTANLLLLYTPGALLMLFVIQQTSSFPLFIPLTALSLLGAFLLFRSATLERLESELKITKDNRRELEFLTVEHQRTQAQQQDNEIHLATLRERNRIAREIHDNVGHLLSRSILLLGALKATNKDPSLTEPIRDLSDSLTKAMENIRSSVHDLHDESIDLEQCTKELIAAYQFCPIRLDYDMSTHINREVKYCFLSIIKEALLNTAKHSNATEVVLTLREHTSLYQLLIQDNGTTKPSCSDEELPLSSSGIGLLNMKDRVRALNGTIHISNHNGFRIFITIGK